MAENPCAHDSNRDHGPHDHARTGETHACRDHAHAHTAHDHAESGDHAQEGEDHDHHGHDHHGHDHGAHGHHHGPGHNHVHAPASYGSAFLIGMGLNIAYIVAETVWGILAHSLSLLSDAGHNLSDVLGLGAAWLAHSLARRAPSARFTYGLKRSTILSALGNAVLLLLVTGGIIWEAVTRLANPGEVAGRVVMLVAAGGILVNGGTALLFMRGGKDDLNLRGAFLHMAADALMSLAVVVTGFIIMMTGWTILDPIVSLIVCLTIIFGTWSLLRASLDMALDGVPEQISLEEVSAALRGLDGVEDLHHLHVWSLSTTETALTVHLVSEAPLSAHDALLRAAGSMLSKRFRIGHATFQIEAPGVAFPCGAPGGAVSCGTGASC
ncbi:cation diffusion facilitator family transporter [Asaia sp. VD9]|uniref:cation diffusion facilitator family transporter n=1 Tax=Asaia sp. VD9 TaxID=3081235 RepID=UPI0038D16753